jgi:hypothetical protein
MSWPVVVQSSAVRASSRARYYANRNRRHAVILRAPFVTGTEPWLTFTLDPLDNGLSFFAFRNPEGDIFECGVGDDEDEALIELYECLIARV